MVGSCGNDILAFMRIIAIKTRPLVPPQDNLKEVIKESIKTLPNKCILAVTSKVAAIHQGRCVPLKAIDRDKLVPLEADLYADRDIVPGQHLMFSVKANTLIASAGIDKSNANDFMILWPEEMDKLVRDLQAFLKETYGVAEVGVVLTDSHVIPMRRGLVGQALAHFGFNPLKNYIGEPDIFGRPLTVSMKNIPDALATAAVVVQGEGNEQTPLALISELDWIEFTEDEKINRGGDMGMRVPLEQDLFYPMLSAVKWKKGRGGLTKKEIRKLFMLY